MSVFNAPIIKLQDDKMNCPTKVYNWIKIVEYNSNNDKDYYLCIDKRVLNNSIFLIKYRIVDFLHERLDFFCLFEGIACISSKKTLYLKAWAASISKLFSANLTSRLPEIIFIDSKL